MREIIIFYLYKFKLKYKNYELRNKSSFRASINTKRNLQAAVDLAASDNYFPETYTGEAPHLTSAEQSAVVGTANGNHMQSVAADRFILDGIPPAARNCTKFAEVHLPLVLVGKLCVHGMIVVFDESFVYIINKQSKKLIARG